MLLVKKCSDDLGDLRGAEHSYLDAGGRDVGGEVGEDLLDKDGVDGLEAEDALGGLDG